MKEIALVGAEVAGAAISVAAGIKAGIHASRIPADAPIKTRIEYDNYSRREVTYTDHPEAYKASNYMALAVFTGAATTIAGIYTHDYLAYIDPSVFFTTTEKDLIGSEQISLTQKVFLPGFRKWKLAKMKERLASNPLGWEQHPELSQKICPISGSLMLFPVRDKCGHFFDYRSVRGYQLHPDTENPVECPISRRKPNAGLSKLWFDKEKFDEIQRLIFDMNSPPAASASDSSPDEEQPDLEKLDLQCQT